MALWTQWSNLGFFPEMLGAMEYLTQSEISLVCHKQPRGCLWRIAQGSRGPSRDREATGEEGETGMVDVSKAGSPLSLIELTHA